MLLKLPNMPAALKPANHTTEQAIRAMKMEVSIRTIGNPALWSVATHRIELPELRNTPAILSTAVVTP